jgi:NADH-quinone oxidoreductase subunit N
MGFPPTAGFLGKLYVFSSAFSLDATHSFHGPLIVLAVIGVLNSVIGAGYYLKLIGAVYLSDKEADLVPASGAPVRWGLALCGIAMVVLFVWPSGLVNKAMANARVVLDGQPVATLTTPVAVAGHSSEP